MLFAGFHIQCSPFVEWACDGSYVFSLQVWQTVGIVSLLIVMGAVGGIAHIGAQSKIIPMVFQQDASANTVSVTLLDRVPDAADRLPSSGDKLHQQHTVGNSRCKPPAKSRAGLLCVPCPAKIRQR